jgi:Ca2+-binding EF-hand superfamily protein
MTKVKTTQKDGAKCEIIAYEDFKNLLKDLLGETIVEHEIVTLCRHFAIETKESPRAHRETVRSIVQGEIIRELWDDIERTKEFIYHSSPENVDFLSDQKMLTVIRGCRIPLDVAIVYQMFEVLNRNEVSEIEVKDFLNFVDVKNCKTAPVPPVNPKKYQFSYETDEGSLINWKQFIASVDLEEALEINGN